MKGGLRKLFVDPTDSVRRLVISRLHSRVNSPKQITVALRLKIEDRAIAQGEDE